MRVIVETDPTIWINESEEYDYIIRQRMNGSYYVYNYSDIEVADELHSVAEAWQAIEELS